MVLSRALRDAVGRLLVGVLLFAQLAVSAHACPMVMAASAPPASTMAAAEHAMPPGCDMMPMDIATTSPNLCAAHCHPSEQSADTAAAPVVLAAVPALLYALPLEPVRLHGSTRPAAACQAVLAAAPEPPHAILHCVFRI